MNANAWKKINQSEFQTATEDLSLVAMGEMLSGGVYREYALIGGGQADSSYRSQEIDGVMCYYGWSK